MVEHNANLPSVQADQQARKNAARELLYDFVQWFARVAGEDERPAAIDVEQYLQEVDRG